MPCEKTMLKPGPGQKDDEKLKSSNGCTLDHFDMNLMLHILRELMNCGKLFVLIDTLMNQLC